MSKQVLDKSKDDRMNLYHNRLKMELDQTHAGIRSKEIINAADKHTDVPSDIDAPKPRLKLKDYLRLNSLSRKNLRSKKSISMISEKK